MTKKSFWKTGCGKKVPIFQIIHTPAFSIVLSMSIFLPRKIRKWMVGFCLGIKEINKKCQGRLRGGDLRLESCKSEGVFFLFSLLLKIFLPHNIRRWLVGFCQGSSGYRWWRQLYSTQHYLIIIIKETNISFGQNKKIIRQKKLFYVFAGGLLDISLFKLYIQEFFNKN